MLKKLKKELRSLANPKIAEHARRFFKTGKGEYGEGDQFIGIRVPVLRSLAKKYHHLPAAQSLELLTSPLHEERMLALFLLIQSYKKENDRGKKWIHKQYLKHTSCINNWDLVDCSAEHIVGAYLADKSRKKLNLLAKSKNLWERRISIISTFRFIKMEEYEDTLNISKILLYDPEDLIHKATGWMLREIGKRDFKTAEVFILEYGNMMPRTMLRYALEKFPEEKRRKYMKMRT